MNVRINHDIGDVYSDGTIITADQLISDYIDTLNENDSIQWIADLPDNEAVEFIAEAWGLDVTII